MVTNTVAYHDVGLITIVKENEENEENEENYFLSLSKHFCFCPFSTFRDNPIFWQMLRSLWLRPNSTVVPNTA